MRIPQPHALTLLTVLLLHVSSYAQQRLADWAAFTSTKDMNSVLVHNGTVWGATNGGVLRLDLSTQLYTKYNRVNGLAGNRVLSAAADALGHIWFGTLGNGLSRFRPDTNEFDLVFVDFTELNINAMVIDGDRIFVGTDRGISLFQIDKEEVKETYRSLGSLPRNTPVTEIAILNETLWVGTEDGLAWADLSLPNLLDPDSWKVNDLESITDLVVLNDTLFIATGRSLLRTTGNSFDVDLQRNNIHHLGVFRGILAGADANGKVFLRESDGWTFDPSLPAFSGIRSLSRGEEALWVATSDGLRVIGADAPPAPQEPAANQFYDISLNGDELWIASVPNDQGLTKFGIYHFDGEIWRIFRKGVDFLSNLVVSSETDRSGNVWVGTWGDGLLIRDNRGNWNRLNQENSVLNGIGSSRSFVVISDIIRDTNGLMWIANVQIGLAVMDGWPPKRQHLYGQESIGLPLQRDIGKIAIGPDGLKWITTPRNGFILFDDGKTPFESGDEFAIVVDTNSDSRLTSDRTSDILVDRTGQVWVATDNGLNAIRGLYSDSNNNFEIDSWRIYNDGNGLPSRNISALEIDTQGALWIGTDAGLARIGQNGEVTSVLTTANSGLVSNRVNSLRFNEETGELWIGTLEGLGRLQVTPRKEGAASAPVTYPNPFPLQSNGGAMTLTNLPLGSTVRIYTLSGDLVEEIVSETASGTASWDGLNQDGFVVASGIYLFTANDDVGNLVKGKFAVVRAR